MTYFAKLDSGLVVDVHGVRSRQTRVAIVYKAGMRRDPVGRAGLAHLAEHAFMQSLPEDSVSGRGRGSGLTGWTAHTFTDTVELSVACRPEDVADVIDLLVTPAPSERVTRSLVDRQRSVVLEELRLQQGHHGGADTWRFLPAQLFSDWGKGHDGYGSPDMLESYDVHTVASFLDSHYIPSRCAIGVVTGEASKVRDTLCRSDVLERLDAYRSTVSGTVAGPDPDVAFAPVSAFEPPLMGEPLSSAALARRAHIFGWVLTAMPTYLDVGLFIGVCATINQIAWLNRDVFMALGYRSVTVNAGFFDPVRATPPWVCVVTAEPEVGSAGDAEALWDELSRLVRGAFDPEVHRRATALALTDMQLMLSEASQRALMHARYWLLGGERFDERYVRSLSTESFELTRDLSRQFPETPDGQLMI